MNKVKTTLIHPQQARNALAWLLASDADAATKIHSAIASLRQYQFDESKKLAEGRLFDRINWQHKLTENADGKKGEAFVSVECSPSWAALVIHDITGAAIAEVTIELYEGKLVARAWNAANMGDDPTAKVELCDNPAKALKPLKKAAPKRKRNSCDVCSEPARKFILCPNGLEICQECFDNGHG